MCQCNEQQCHFKCISELTSLVSCTNFLVLLVLILKPMKGGAFQKLFLANGSHNRTDMSSLTESMHVAEPYDRARPVAADVAGEEQHVQLPGACSSRKAACLLRATSFQALQFSQVRSSD